MISWISLGSRVVSDNARRAASTARLEVVSWGEAIWRSRIPVLETIHSSLVSTICSNSKLVRTFSGVVMPQPVTCAYWVINQPHSWSAYVIQGKRYDHQNQTSSTLHILALQVEHYCGHNRDRILDPEFHS